MVAVVIAVMGAAGVRMAADLLCLSWRDVTVAPTGLLALGPARRRSFRLLGMSVIVAVVVMIAILIVIAVMAFVLVIAVALGVNRRGANGCGQCDPQCKLPCRNRHRRTSHRDGGQW